MKVMMTFQQCLVVTLLVTARASAYLSWDISEVDSVKFSSFNCTLELKWENGETDSAVLVDKGDCIYDGQLARDAVSSILVTGCKDAFINVQIQSELFGDHLFSLNNGLVAYEVMEEHEYDLYPDYLESDEFPVAAQGNGRLKRALDDYYYYDEAEENPEFEKDYIDISESELSDLTIPTNFILNLNVYLDQNFVIKFGSYTNATRIAKQIMEQVKRLYTDNSLETKFDIQHGGRFYRSSAPHLVAKKSGLRVLNSHIKSPYTIGKDEKVAHVHLTTELGRKNKYLGKATISGLCKEGINMAIAAYSRAGVVRTAMTVAHEIGHLLGMYHDFKTVPTQRNTCAKKGDGLVIMNYGNNRIQWSNCSNQDFKTFYQRIIVTTKTFCLRSPNLGCQCNGKVGPSGGECEQKDRESRAWCYVDEHSICSDKKEFFEDFLSYEACGCGEDQFECDTGSCIPESQHCDGRERNCPNGEDEAGCDYIPWY